MREMSDLINKDMFITLSRLGLCRVVILDGMFASYDDPPFEVQVLGAYI